MSEPDPLELAVTLRPQGFGRAPVDRIDQPVVEPLWPGLRVIAAARGPEGRFFADGAPVDDQALVLRALTNALERSTDGTILDGYLTKLVVTDEPGAGQGFEDELPSTGSLIARSMIGVRRDRTAEATQRLEAETAARTFAPEDAVNFVAIDVLWLDGEWLLDVPLLERKRLLEAILPSERLVRPGLFVLPPVQTWIGSWRAQGFRGVSFKAANSRYRPGERCEEWATADMPRR